MGVKGAAEIRGEDVRHLMTTLRGTAADMQWQMGMSPNKWSDVVNAGAERIVPDPATRIMVRLLRRAPALKLFDDPPDMLAAYRLMDRLIREIPGFEGGLFEAQLGLLLGRDRSAAHNWMARGDKPNPVVQHLVLMFLDAITMDEHALRNLIIPVIQEEAASQGVEDIFKAARWP